MTRHMHAVRAASPQEAEDYNRVRVAFLRDVVADVRTGRWFEFWADKLGLDPAIAALARVLDGAAQRAGLASRAMLLEEGGEHVLYNSLPDMTARVQVAHFMDQKNELLTVTRPSRTIHAQGFVIAVLYGTTVDEDVPVRAWLADDLVKIFDAMVTCKVWGIPVRLIATLPPRVDVPQRRRGKRLHGDVDEWAHWYYRVYVAQPRATAKQLAREARAAGFRIGDRNNGPEGGRDTRPDESKFEYGIRQAKRLLELPVPPEQWTAYFAELCPGLGGSVIPS